MTTPSPGAGDPRRDLLEAMTTGGARLDAALGPVVQALEAYLERVGGTATASGPAPAGPAAASEPPPAGELAETPTASATTGPGQQTITAAAAPEPEAAPTPSLENAPTDETWLGWRDDDQGARRSTRVFEASRRLAKGRALELLRVASPAEEREARGLLEQLERADASGLDALDDRLSRLEERLKSRSLAAARSTLERVPKRRREDLRVPVERLRSAMARGELRALALATGALTAKLEEPRRGRSRSLRVAAWIGLGAVLLAAAWALVEAVTG